MNGGVPSRRQILRGTIALGAAAAAAVTKADVALNITSLILDDVVIDGVTQ